jgi:plastocyanin
MKKKLFALGLLASVFILNTEGRQIQVNVLNLQFSPKNFSARIGDTIHFVWVAGIHTTSSTSVPAGALAWNVPIDNTHLSFFYPVKVAGNYSYRCNFHFTMGMVATFNIPFVSKLAVTREVSVNNCTTTNSVQYKCTLSKPPYRVQLFRYGLAFGAVRTVADTLPFTYSNLPLGSYFATAKGNGGADTVPGVSRISILMPVPGRLPSAHITSTKATIKWTGYSCVKFYTVQFRRKGTTTWNKINTLGNKDSLNLTALTPNTKYQFQVAAVDSARKIIATGRFSAIDSFMTAVTGLTSLRQNKSIISTSTDSDEAVSVFPNPVSVNLRIQIKNKSFVAALIRSIDGKVVWKQSNRALLEKGKELNVNVSNIPGGNYLLELIDVHNNSIFKKIIVVK